MKIHPYATREEVRAFDRYCIEKLGIPGVVLMENAGRQIAGVVVDILAKSEFRHTVILAGTGNNGGDTFVVARHMKVHGYDAEILLLGTREDVKGDADANLSAIEAMGFYVHELDGTPDEITNEIAPTLLGADLILDGLLGTGAQGEIREPFASVIKAVNRAARMVVAVDIPSGLDCDTGKPLGPTVRAAKTVTMAALKAGFKNPDATQYTGEVVMADIGAPWHRAGGEA
jgi:NAD(P)H-hydrate epimerase